MSRINVIGGGYVGLVTSACFAELGHQVTCVEIGPVRLDALRQGQLPIFEPKLDELVFRNTASGHLRFTDDYASTIPSSEFVFIAVNTPPTADGSADTQYVFKCLDSIIEYAHAGQIVVVKSTVPVGTGDEVSRKLRLAGLEGVAAVSNPEFLRQGSAVDDFMIPDRIVVGADDEASREAVASLYESLDAIVVHCTRRSAELAKYAANALLATRISFMNEVGAVCEALNGDIEEVAEIMGLDPRIGPHYLRAGLGWGGSCFPKDVRALAALADRNGIQTPIIRAAFEINCRQRELAFSKIMESIQYRQDPVVGVLGLAFKPNTDDLRESPSIEIIQRLLDNGIRVRAHDPVAMENSRAILPSITYCGDPYEVAAGADILFLATEWEDYRELDWSRLSGEMRGVTVLDGRHVLESSNIHAEGLTYLSFGRYSLAGQGRVISLPSWLKNDAKLVEEVS